MKKKSDKIVMLLIFTIGFALLTWFIDGGMYDSGVFASTGRIRAGIYDIFLVIYSALYYRTKDILYILVVGGCYGVLTQTKTYRKLVEKTASLIKRYDIYVFIGLTLLTSAYVSITTDIFVLFFIAPFIVSVFLRNGRDRLTAISAGFGGMFVGYLGLTFGTYGLSFLNDSTGLGYTEWPWVKLAVLAIALVLFNLFAILHMKNTKKVDETKYDMFAIETLEEDKKKKKTKVWPTALIIGLTVIVVMLGYVNWLDSFNVQVFNEIQTSFEGAFKIGETPMLSAVVGDYMTAFGTWADLLTVAFMFLIATIIIAIMNKTDVNTFVKYFGIGAKKISKVAVIYGLAHVALFLCSAFPWPVTLINNLFTSESFNIIFILLGAILATTFTCDPGYSGYVFSPMLATTFTENIIATSILWRIGSAIALVIAPTSYILVSMLAYADVPYTNWMKYIWKFILSFTIAVLILFAVICYM